jgi:hypothetical protein
VPIANSQRLQVRIIGGRVYGAGEEGYETEKLAASATSDFKWAKAEGWDLR